MRTHDLGKSENPDGRDLDTIFTIPNLISLIRLLLIPAFISLLLDHHNGAAFIVFAVASGSDWLDGTIARKTGTVSKLGRQLDPFIDRILIASTVIGLFFAGYLPLWCMLVLIARDAVLAAGFFIVERRTTIRIPVIFIGKVTTACLFVGFADLILQWPKVPGLGLFELAGLPGWGSEPAALGMWLVYLGIILSIITAILYIRTAVRYLKQAPSTPVGDTNER